MKRNDEAQNIFMLREMFMDAAIPICSKCQFIQINSFKSQYMCGNKLTAKTEGRKLPD